MTGIIFAHHVRMEAIPSVGGGHWNFAIEVETKGNVRKPNADAVVKYTVGG